MVANQGDQQDVKLASCEPAEDKSRALVWERGYNYALDLCPLIFLYLPWLLPELAQ